MLVASIGARWADDEAVPPYASMTSSASSTSVTNAVCSPCRLTDAEVLDRRWPR